ncbi:hypothetical protein [Roseomonas rosulenta]|uniref:hypothetical protein n=1 Tax=Roseomonas rosulenta TaxID=2748667 RepID=UPI0018DFD871|nr:hypothetical protein [Roseomonas rosulenta]
MRHPRRPLAARTRDPVPAPFRVVRAMLAGTIGIGLPVLLHAILLPIWGEDSAALFIVFMLALLVGTGACFVYAGGGMLRTGYAMCIVVGAGFISLSLHEGRILGAVPSLDAAAAPDHLAAAGFLLPGAAPRAGLARQVEVTLTQPRQALRGASRGTTTLRGRFTVVPVVDADWTPARPVPIVAVLDHGPDRGIGAVTTAPWESGHGVLRLLPDPLRERAVRQALAEAGLEAAPQIVVGRWVADPRWARLDAARPLIWLSGAAMLGWAVVILSAHPWLAVRLPGPVDGPPTMTRAILQGIAALTLPCLLALALRHAAAGPAVMLLAIGFAAVPSLMLAIVAFDSRTPVGVLIAGVILMVFVPLAVAARGAGPGGLLPPLEGARLDDILEAGFVVAAGWLAWAALVVAGRVLGRRARP